MSEKFQPSKKLTRADGTVAYVWEGKLHNTEGPALIHPDGKKEYHIHGIKYTVEGFKEYKRNREGLPWYKGSSANIRNVE